MSFEDEKIIEKLSEVSLEIMQSIKEYLTVLVFTKNSKKMRDFIIQIENIISSHLIQVLKDKGLEKELDELCLKAGEISK